MTSLQKTTSFQLIDYEIHFESVYTNSDMQKSFRKFLEIEFNTEPFDLVVAIRNLNPDNEFTNSCQTIIDQFIKVDSKKEVNLAGSTRKEILTKFDLYNKHEFPLEDFHKYMFEITSIFNKEMKADNFPRFVRSKLFQSIAPSMSLIKDVMISRMLYNFPYTTSDFSIPAITKKDLEFVQYLARDYYDWKLHFSKPGCNAYYTELDAFPNVPFMKSGWMLKVDCILPYSFDVCLLMNSNFELSRIHAKNIDAIEVLGYYKAEDVKKEYPDVETIGMDCMNVVSYTTFMYPMDMRRVSQIVTSLVVGDTFKMICRPYIDKKSLEIANYGERGVFEYEKDGKKKSKQMYQMPTYTSTTLTKLDANKTLYTDTIVTRVGGWLDGDGLKKYLQSMALEKVANDVFTKYKKLSMTHFAVDSTVEQHQPIFSKDSGQGKLLDNALKNPIL